MGKVLAPLISVFKFHKLKVLFVLLVAVVLVIWNFPPGDLSDLVSDKASRATGIYMQFDSLGVALNPSPGVHADKLVIEPPDVPAIKADDADVFVSVLSAIMGQVSASARLGGVFKGDVNVEFADGDKMKSGDRIKNISIVTQKLDLGDVSDYLRNANMLALSLKGALSLTSAMKIDPSFSEQPSGTVGLDIASFSMPSQMLQTQMGPLQSPPLSLGKVTVQAKMNDGNLELTDVNFGGSKDGLSGKVTGQIAVSLRKQGTMVNPVVGAYKLGVNLTIPKVFLTSNPTFGMAVGLLDGMVGRFKQETPTEVKYAFNAAGMPGGVPNFSAK